MKAPRLAHCLALAALVGLPLAAGAGTINQIGVFTSWPTLWTPILGLNDPAGDAGTYSDPIPERVDFVGDAGAPGGYYASQGDYLFFRMRANGGTVTGSGTDSGRTYKDTMSILIDIVGSTVNPITGALVAGETAANQRRPDYGFSWDSNLPPAGHGLEMQMAINYLANTWGDTSLQDLDQLPGSKGTNDINGGGRSSDGYVRTIDSQGTSNFGLTTFIDYAISWAYLTTYTHLLPSQTWNITFTSIQSGNDHSNINADVAAGATVATDVNSPTLGWAEVDVDVPVPASLPLMALGLVVLHRARRRGA